MLTRVFIILIIVALASLIILMLRIFKKPIRQWAYNLRARLKITSLRSAIKKADDMNRKTGRKIIVVFNKSTNEYEAVEKKILKKVALVNRNKNNAALTDGRVRVMKAIKPKTITTKRLKVIEQKSLYVSK